MSAMSTAKVVYRQRVGAGSQPLPANMVTTTIGEIVTYIPTEVVVLYTAVLAALSAAGPVSTTGRWAAFSVTLVASPFVVLLLYAAQVRAGEDNEAPKLRSWPLLEMSVSAVAFAAWALALPDSPFSELDWYSPAVAAATVVVVTIVLGLVAPLFRKPAPVQ